MMTKEGKLILLIIVGLQTCLAQQGIIELETPNHFRPTFQLPGDDDLEEIHNILTSYDNSLCSTWRENVCIKCSPRSYFDSNGKCQPVDPLCENFDQKNGKCKSCYAGYTFSQGKCLPLSQNLSQDDPLCRTWKNGKCIACADRAYRNPNGFCQFVSSNCKQYREEDGKCTKCYSGFDLKNGQCLKSQRSQPIDSLCTRSDKNGKCLQCSLRSYLGNDGVCQSVNPQCNDYDRKTGACKSCYGGYKLSEGKCLVVNEDKKVDRLCVSWRNNKCSECANRSFLNLDGTCEQIDANCQMYDKKTGECFGCYDGFKVKGRKCVLKDEVSEDQYCIQWNRDRTRCVSCAQGTFLSPQYHCMLVDPQCRRYSNQTGECFQCYGGYDLQKGKCVVAYLQGQAQESIEFQLNPLCAQWRGNKCSKCSYRSYFDGNGFCKQIDPNCREFSEEKKQCESCYGGYKLSRNNQTCSIQINEPVQQGYSDVLCAQWSSPLICKKCASDAFMKPQTKKCQRKDDNCKDFSVQKLECLECYNGWSLIGGKCYSYTFNFSEEFRQISVWACQHWIRGQCLKCSQGFQYSSVSKRCECSEL